jgi:acyl-CoA thioester hydrolase
VRDDKRGDADREGSPHRFELRVYYEDTDFSGLVYHASYLRFLERGRTEWLRARDLGQKQFAAETGIVFAVKSLSIDYRRSAAMDDLLRIETHVANVGGASVEFAQMVSRAGDLLASARVRVVALKDGRPTRLPGAIRARLHDDAG